jgi:type IV pilus assembly protein PilV
MTRAQPSSRPRASGFMLLEVLVAILIFSIGVLSLIGLQARMTHAQTAAKIRADAAYLASELIGVMWSDIANLGDYNDCGSNRCTDWQTKVEQAMPGATTSVTVDGSTGEVNISISWTQASDGTHTYTTRTFIKASS